MPAIDLVIFDFDGTLVDTAPDIIRATNLFLENKGLEALPKARIRGEIGMGLKRLLTDVYPTKNLSPEDELALYAEFTEVYAGEFLKTPVLFEGALEFLHDWDGQIAIVSNKRERFLTPIVEKLDLHRLPWVRIVCGDTQKTMKPHPEPFMTAIRAASTTPEKTLIVGDGIPDVEGAKNIGSLCVAVDFGYTPPEDLLDLGAWKRLSSFTELNALIDTIT